MTDRLVSANLTFVRWLVVQLYARRVVPPYNNTRIQYTRLCVEPYSVKGSNYYYVWRLSTIIPRLLCPSVRYIIPTRRRRVKNEKKKKSFSRYGRFDGPQRNLKHAAVRSSVSNLVVHNTIYTWRYIINCHTRT